MRVISIKRLRDFWSRHAATEIALRTWYKITSKAQWTSITDVRQVFPQADAVQLDCGAVVTIFNIRGNEIRLAAVIEYEFHTVYVKQVMTHPQYSKDKWKVTICNERRKK